ncbi:MAG: hypothetical protein R3E61_10725 [Pseudomonadales bacterium]
MANPHAENSTTMMYCATAELGFTYTRSTGPIIGAFLTGLRDGLLVGIKGSGGK